MKRLWKRRNESFDLEAELRAHRPEPRSDFLHALALRVREERVAPRLRSPRVVFAAGFTAATLVALASVGGFGYAASGAKEAISAMDSAFSSGSTTNTKGPSKAQYAKKCGVKPPLNRCRALVPDIKVTEGNSGTKPATFNVQLDAVPQDTITIGYVTQDGTATAPSDYLPATGTIRFDPGEVDHPVSVAVVGDTVREPSETFVLHLLNPSEGVILEDPDGTAVILNDDK